MLCDVDVSSPCFRNQFSAYLRITRIISKSWDVPPDIQRQSSAPGLCLGRTLGDWPKESPRPHPTHLALTGTHNRWVSCEPSVSTPVGTRNHKGLNELRLLTPSCHNLRASCAPLWCFYFMGVFTQLLPLEFLRNSNHLPEVSQPLYTDLVLPPAC